MRVVIGSNKKGSELKEKVKKYLEDGDYEVLDVTPESAEDFVESSLKVMHEVLDHGTREAIVFDEYGVGSAAASNRVKGMATADVNEEKTGYMATMHNEAKALAIGSGIVGEKFTESITDYYLHTEYADGRHQVRLDVLEKMI